MNCLKYFCAILILILLKCYWCFNVNFRENYNIQVEPFKTQIFKREMTQFFDKGKIFSCVLTRQGGRGAGTGPK